MPIPLRLALMGATLCVLVFALLRGGVPGLSTPFGPDLEGMTLVALPAPDAPRPARLTESTRADLTGYGADYDYAPDPAQGTRHRTPTGVSWWGAGPTEGAPRPAILLLHGSGRTGHSLVDMWHEVAEAEGLILVAPDLGPHPDPRFVDDPLAALEALAQAAQIYPVDPERIALFGHSRGGVAAQRWVNRLDGPWRAAAVHGGTLPVEHVGPVADGIPVVHFLGSVDPTSPFADARESAKAMAAAGHPFELVRLDGHGHWFYETGEAISAAAWTWMAPHMR